MPEALGLSLEERKSTATLQLGPEDPEIPVGSWLLDDEPGTGEGIVWRTRSVDMTFNTDTRQLTLEHIISTLQDAVLFGEHTYEDIAGAGASACSARAAAQYILARQSLWTLGDFDFDDIAWPYKFNGDTLFSALQTVTNSCPDACWEYDLSRIPFRVHIRRISSETTCEMRAGRNIRTLKRVIDRSGMYTRFYPIGKDDLHISGDYISKNESVYGMVAKVETFSGAETESSLRSWAWERLNRHCEPKVTVTISGLDLSESTGESLDRLTIGRKCRVPLPEFGTTITERITRIRVTDKIRKKEEVTVTLGNELPDLASIVGDVEKEQASGRGGGGRGGMKQAGEDHAWFVDTDEHVGMVAEAIIGHGPDGVDWSRVAEVIVDGNGIHNRVTRAEGYLVVMEAKIDLTEEKLRAEFTDVTASLRSELEMSAASLRVEFENLNNSTRSELQITSESLRTEFTNEINSTRSELQITSQSLRTEFTNEINSTRSELQITSQSLRTEFTNEINSTRSELQITSQSLRTEFTNEINSTRSELQITSQSLRSTITNTAEGLQSQIDQNAEAISLKVSNGDVATQLSVECGNVSVTGGNLTVDGMVTANSVQSAIAQIAALSVIGLNASGTIKSTSGVQAPDFNLTGGGALSNAVQQIFDGVADGGRVTFTYSHFAGQNGTFSFNIADTQYYQDGVAAALARGKAASLKDAVLGAKVQGQKWYVNITKADDSTQLLEVNLASAYADARNGYTLGTFTPATVTTQGTGVSIQEIGSAVYFKSESITPVGTKYSAVANTVTVQGTGVSIQAIGSAVYFKPVSITPISTGYAVTARTRYLRGTSKTALTGYSNYNSGSSITLYRRSTNSYGDVTYSSAGYHVWRYGGSTETLYESGGSATDYDVGSGASGKTLYEAGTAVTRYEKVSAGGSGISTYYNAKTAQDYYQAGSPRTFYTHNNNSSGDLYAAGTAVTRYEKVNAGGSGISTYYNAKTAQDYYKKGETVTDTYYTKA